MEIITQILERVMEIGGFKTEGAVAKAVGETVANFSNKKKTGTIKEKLLIVGIEHGARLEWLRTGQGDMRASPGESEKWKDKYYELLEKHQTLLEELMKLKEPWTGKERRVANLPSVHGAK